MFYHEFILDNCIPLLMMELSVGAVQQPTTRYPLSIRKLLE